MYIGWENPIILERGYIGWENPELNRQIKHVSATLAI